MNGEPLNIVTVAGRASFTGNGLLATQAKLSAPEGIALDPKQENLYIADSNNKAVRIVDSSTGKIEPFAGTGVPGLCRDGEPALQAKLGGCRGITVDAFGNLYIADIGNHRILKVDTDKRIWTLAGRGQFDKADPRVDLDDGGPAKDARLAFPECIVVDKAGNVYFTDGGNARVRVIAAGGTLPFPVTPSGNISRGTIWTVAGKGPDKVTGARRHSGDGGLAVDAEFNELQGIALDLAENLYVFDSGVDIGVVGGGGGPRVRVIASGMGLPPFPVTPPGGTIERGTIWTVAGGGTNGLNENGAATQAQLFGGLGIALDDTTQDLYIADSRGGRSLGNNCILRVKSGTGVINRFVGTMQIGLTGDGDSRLAANLSGPSYGLVLDKAHNLYFADNGANRIRVCTAGTSLLPFKVGSVAADTIWTIAGGGSAAFSDGTGLPTNANLNSPTLMDFDARGNMFFCDSGNHSVCKIDPDGAQISRILGTGTSGSGAGELNNPTAVACESPTVRYIADTGNNCIRKMDTNNGTTRVVGTTAPGSSGNGPALTSDLRGPRGLALRGPGELYFADTGNHCVRFANLTGGEVTVYGSKVPNGEIRTVAGKVGQAGFSKLEDGHSAINAKLNGPSSVVFDRAGNLYISDTNNRRVRKVAPNGIITTISGTDSRAQSIDGTLAKDFSFNLPRQLAFDPNGDPKLAFDRQGAPMKESLFVVDAGNSRVVRLHYPLDGTAQVTTVAGMTPIGGFTGDGFRASELLVNRPEGLAFDPFGNLHIVDTGNDRIRRLNVAAMGVMPIFESKSTLSPTPQWWARVDLENHTVTIGTRPILIQTYDVRFAKDLGTITIQGIDAGGQPTSPPANWKCLDVVVGPDDLWLKCDFDPDRPSVLSSFRVSGRFKDGRSFSGDYRYST